MYEKFLKHRTILNNERYKPYKYLFESIKQKTNKSHFSKQILLYKNNRKNTWNVMKEIISKMYQYNKSKLPHKPIAHETEIAKKFY